MARLRKTSLADADVTAAILHLREKNPQAAMAFVSAFEQTLARIREFPELFRCNGAALARNWPTFDVPSFAGLDFWSFIASRLTPF